MQKYLLGIDVGNSKTEHLLCTTEGEFVGIYHVPSPSKSDYNKMIPCLKEQIKVLLERCNINVESISAAGFGIAQTYTPSQTSEIEELIKNIFGVEKIHFSTDTGHGTYAKWMGRGKGIYSFASTGDITMGCTTDNKWMIVGGMVVNPSGDASGAFLYKKAADLLNDYYYRCGKDSIVFPELISLLGLDETNLRKSLKEVKGSSLKKMSKDIISLMDDGALAGDEVAVQLFREAGISSGMSSAGCIKNMTFSKEITEKNPVQIVLIGSIWNKIINDNMRDAYKKTVQELAGMPCKISILEAPPVVGGVLKAKEALDGKRVTEDYRTKVLESTALGSTKADIAALQKDELPNIELLRYLVTAKKNKPQTAAILDIDEMICGMIKKHPMLKSVSADLASALYPAISSILLKDYKKAFDKIVSASAHLKIASEDVEAYNQLVTTCGTKVNNKDYFIRFQKA